MVYHYCPPIITYHNHHLHLPLPQGVLRGYVCCCNCNPGNHTPLYTVYCSYYNYTILYSLFTSTFYKIYYCFRSWGMNTSNRCIYPFFRKKFPTICSRWRKGRVALCCSSPYHRDVARLQPKPGQFRFLLCTSPMQTRPKIQYAVRQAGRESDFCCLLVLPITSLPGRTAAYLKSRRLLTHNMSCYVTCSHETRIQRIIFCRGSGSREEQDQHWSCHNTTIATNWRLPTFLEHSA